MKRKESAFIANQDFTLRSYKKKEQITLKIEKINKQEIWEIEIGQTIEKNQLK